VIIQLP